MDEFENRYFDEIDDVAADESDYKEVKDALLFAIEINESMLELDATTGLNSARMALESAYDTITGRTIANVNDVSGIMLFGVEPAEGDDERYPTCRILMPLEAPGSDSVKNLKWILEDEERFAEVCRPAQSAKLSMADVFFLANQQFNVYATKFPSKRLFLITNNDNPHPDRQRLAALTRANDLVQSRVMILPGFITSEKRPFNTKLFYEEIEYRTAYNQDSSLDRIVPQPVSQLALKDEIKSRRNLRRSLFRNRIELAPDLFFGVKGYLVYAHQKPTRSYYVYTAGETPMLVKHTTKVLSQESLKELEPQDVKRTYKLGDYFIPLKPEQIAEMKYFDDPVIRIIGFKPTSAIEPWMNVTHSVFLYPSDSDYIGSIRGFTSLYKSMLKLDRVAIAWAVLRRNATPIICALYAAPEDTEELNGTKIQTSPPGIHLIRLPFADDIRQRPYTGTEKASDTLIDSFRKVVTTLRMPRGYEPSRYPNPRLQWFYRLLQATALDEEMPAVPADNTVPKYNSINTKAGDLMLGFNKQLAVEFDEQAGSKRGIEDEASEPKKRAKADHPVLEESDVRHSVKNNNLKKYTAKQLSEFAHSRGIHIEGSKKQDYIDGITEAMG